MEKQPIPDNHITKRLAAIEVIKILNITGLATMPNLYMIYAMYILRSNTKMLLIVMFISAFINGCIAFFAIRSIAYYRKKYDLELTSIDWFIINKMCKAYMQENGKTTNT